MKRFLLGLLALALLPAACNHEAAAPDAAVDSAAPASDMAVASDLAAADLMLLPPDLVPVPDLPPPDLPPPGEVALEVQVQALFEDCMPIVAPDPVRLMGTLVARNGGGAAAGPFTVAGGTFEDGKGGVIARFTVAPIAPFMVEAGRMASIQFTKQDGSLNPADGCKTLPCNNSSVVGLDVKLNGAPYARGRSTPATMQCAF